MSTSTYGPSGRRADLNVRRLLAVNRPLTLVGLLMLATLLGTLVGLIVDQRVITGAPAWLKPAKFAVSTSIYAFTFVWLLSFVRGHQRAIAIIATGTAIGLTLEVAAIVVQVVRGTTSHFNYSTPLDSAVFVGMAVVIAGVWLLGAAAAVLLLLQRLPDSAFAWSLRLGLLIALVGMAVAFAMPQQSTAPAMEAGIVGAHSVGVPDGGAGLPIVGWSTLGGDLRAPHFVGLHALQFLPILGWLLARQRRLSRPQRVVLIWTAGMSYLGVVLVLTWQALRGQSVIAPDGLTLMAYAALGLLALAVTAITLALGAHAPARLNPHLGTGAAE